MVASAKNQTNGSTVQAKLFSQEQGSFILENNHSSFNDPAFANNRSSPVHRWTPWIAGYSSDFVKHALNKYLNDPGVVLDPFAGVGTTLVDSFLLGHNSYGFEINPYAAFVSRVKAGAYKVPTQSLNSEMQLFRKFLDHALKPGYKVKSEPPKGFKTRFEFYSPKILKKVLIIHDFINQIQDENIRDIFRLAFASTMVKYSNYSYEPSLGARVSSGKENIDDFPVDKAIMTKLTEIVEDIAWLQKNMPPVNVPQISIFNDSFFNYSEHLAPESINLILTSPPYLNNYHYIRNTRPQMYWLDFVKEPKDTKPLENFNFGNYWQTVREKENIELNFSLPDSNLPDQLEILRNKNPEKGIYGGNGWANYAASYFNDCYRFSVGIKYLLKEDGVALVVLGNSILQGIMIPTDRYFGEIAESVGLELIKIDIPRQTRVGNSIIQSNVRVGKTESRNQLYESVVELKKL
jgi:DNA modification methylase